MAEYHILNLGAGVQSTTLYLLSMEGRIQKFDAAVFADTQDEPGAEERRLGLPDPPESVYAHLDWLQSLGGPPILVRTKGCLSEDLLRGENSTGQRFASIPAFTAPREGAPNSEIGQIRRQCTKEYKIEVIQRAIRRDVLGLAPRRTIPRDCKVIQYIGISYDERTRAVDIERRFLDRRGRPRPRWRVEFPLLFMNGWARPGWTRTECVAYLEVRVPHKVYESACVQCPYRSDASFRRVLEMPASGPRLIQIDSGLRVPGVVVNRGLDQQLYLHRSCVPIERAVHAGDAQMGFAMECEGGCGL